MFCDEIIGGIGIPVGSASDIRAGNNPLTYTDPSGLYTSASDGPWSAIANGLAEFFEGLFGGGQSHTDFSAIAEAPNPPSSLPMFSFSVDAWCYGCFSSQVTSYFDAKVAEYKQIQAKAATRETQLLSIPWYISSPLGSARGVRFIDPSAVRFTQNSIRPPFTNEVHINDVVLALRGSEGANLADSFKPIRLVLREGILWTLDNRRRAAFAAAGRQVPFVMARDAEIALE